MFYALETLLVNQSEALQKVIANSKLPVLSYAPIMIWAAKEELSFLEDRSISL
jgi:hypothetical protein